MPIYQPFLNTEIGEVRQPGPVAEPDGFQHLARGVGQLMQVGARYLEGQQGDGDEVSQEYLTAVEEASQLRAQGDEAGARALLRRAGVAAARAGYDISDPLYDEVRLQAGVGDPLFVDREREMEDALRNNSVFQQRFWAIEQEYKKAGKPVDYNQIFQLAKNEFARTTSLELQISDKKLDLERRVQLLPQYISERMGQWYSTMTAYATSGVPIGSEEWGTIRAAIGQTRQNLYEMIEFDKSGMEMIDRAADNVNTMLGLAEKLSSAQGFSEAWKQNVTAYLFEEASKPGGLRPKDFQLYMDMQADGNSLTTMQDRLTALIGSDPSGVGPAIREQRDSALRIQTYMTKYAELAAAAAAERAGATRFDPTGRNAMDSTVDPQNRLITAVEQDRVSSAEGGEPDTWLDFYKKSKIGEKFDNNLIVTNPKEKERLVLNAASAAATVLNTADKNRFVEDVTMRQMFTPELGSALEALADADPASFYDTVDYLTAASGIYGAHVTTQANAYERYGISLNTASGEWEFSLKTIAESREGVTEGMIKQALREAYGVDNDDDALSALVKDRNVGRLTRYLQAKRNAATNASGAGDQETLSKVFSVLTEMETGLSGFEPAKLKTMWTGAKHLNQFVGKLQNKMRVSDPQINVKLERYTPLLGALAVHEAGTYKTIWGNSEGAGKRFANTDITTMTIGHLVDVFAGPNSEYRKFATADARAKGLIGDDQSTAPLGLYQIQRRTLLDIVDRDPNLNRSMVFSEETQDYIFTKLVERRLKQGRGDLMSTVKALRKEWQGLTNVSDERLMQIVAEITGIALPEEEVADE